MWCERAGRDFEHGGDGRHGVGRGGPRHVSSDRFVA